MSSVMFPMSQKATPKINAERLVTEQTKNAEFEGGGATQRADAASEHANPVVFEPHTRQAVDAQKITDSSDQPDETLKEMGNDARVWKTYVRETDRWDKEMVDGRSNSLDVLLIFAALFSAVSTTFIVEGLNDLKPDPAESSAQTLLVMSQTLAAIANNQPVPLYDKDISSLAAGSPPRMTILVNTLWLLSLSLSVLVSLIAMLAKDWCYRFMSGRFGQIYNQARIRQRKWNGMEKWKMQEVLTYLPALMHLAVLLFAIGLSIYLWGINISVALPVTAVTAVGVCVYISATILPAVDRFCPYNTPVTALLARFGYAAYQLAEVLRWKSRTPKWLRSALGYSSSWLMVLGHGSNYANHQNNLPPMDTVTSQMLAWMITNCEDTRSVDIALQAIAGAGPELPRAQLLQCQALKLLCVRLEAYNTQLEAITDEGRLKDVAVLATALTYSRALSALALGVDDAWTQWGMTYGAKFVQEKLRWHANQAEIDPKVIEAAMSVPLSPRNNHSQIDPTEQYAKISFTLLPERELAVEMLRKHVQNKQIIPALSLLTLLENSVYYLVGVLSRDRHRKESSLPAILIRIFLTSYGAAPDVACTVSVALAAAAFAVVPHHDAEARVEEEEDRQKRAIQMLHHYQTHKPDEDTAHRLFVFGFVGLLPWVDFRLDNIQDAALPSLFAKAVMWVPPSGFEYQIYGQPDSWSCQAHYNFCVRRCLLRVAFNPDEEPIVALSMTTISQAGFTKHWDKSRLYLPALITLRHAQSSKLQDICLEFLESTNLSFAIHSGLELMERNSILRVMTSGRQTIATPVIPAFLFYFRRFVAGIMLSTFKLVDRRQTLLRIDELQELLRRLLNCEPFAKLSLAADNRASISEGQILAHVAEDTYGVSEADGMLGTMQLVATFCHAGIYLDILRSPGWQPQDHFMDADWAKKLLSIERQFRTQSPKVQDDGSNISEGPSRRQAIEHRPRNDEEV